MPILLALLAFVAGCEPAFAQRIIVVPQGKVASEHGRQVIERHLQESPLEAVLGGHDAVLRPFLAPEPGELPHPVGSPPTQEEIDFLTNLVITAVTTFVPGKIPAAIGLLTLSSSSRQAPLESAPTYELDLPKLERSVLDFYPPPPSYLNTPRLESAPIYEFDLPKLERPVLDFYPPPPSYLNTPRH